METKAGLPVVDFSDLAAWEGWLAQQPRDAKGLWLKLAKAGNHASSLTKAQAIDGALCATAGSMARSTNTTKPGS